MTINPLFVALLAAGAVLILGVLVYNWVQARRLRDRRRSVSARLDGDAKAARDAGHGRAEPVLAARGDAEAKAVPQSAGIAGAGEASEAESITEGSGSLALPQKLAARTGREGIAPDADIECVVWLTPSPPAPSSALAQSLATACAKPTRWLGRSGSDPHWRAIDGAGGPWDEIAACMLLADRNGAATRDDLEGFLRLVDSAAGTVHAECVWPDERDEAGRAEALDRLCADLDVQIGLTLLKSEANQIAGTRLRGVAEASGFRLRAAGQFEYVQEETGAVLYSLQNLRDEPFTLESLRAGSVAGVVLLLDVPRVAEPVKVFDQMRLLARRLAQTLEATIVDDNHRPVDDAALAAIRAQVQATAAALREAHIEPGGQRALRLFG